MVRVSPFLRNSLVAAFAAAATPALIQNDPVYAQEGQPYTVGKITSQPIGHYEFCKEYLSECSIKTPNPTPLKITDKYWRMIQDVNVSVNKAVQGKNDMDIYGKEEVWAYPKDEGDCEDYVLEKRRQLHDKGIPLSNLLITVVRKPDNEGHAILTIPTDKGDYILDNLTNEVKKPEETNYKFLKRVSAEHSGIWRDLIPMDVMETASTVASKSVIEPAP